jgi:hypothetical protein
MNPYLPSWEYIPDGEPHEYDGRVYVYGSHDRFRGNAYCMNDYICYSASSDDLTDWHYEGVIYRKTQDPENKDGSMCLFAPDVTKGPDGRYYLFYVLDKLPVVSVAVSDTPGGKYDFYGYVHYSDGVRLGEGSTDEAQFDPAVITEGDITYMYTGFCMPDDKSRHGAMVSVLGRDMLTVLDGPRFIVPSKQNSKGTVFEEHEYFEAPSIRKYNDMYFFIYSSINMHELCYATSTSPTDHFMYRGAIISNNDIGIDSYKRAGRPMNYGANNHGGIIRLESGDYVFYHRHTNGTNFSRQGCIERIEIEPDGHIEQVRMTTEGAQQHLEGVGMYPAYIACNLYCSKENGFTGDPGTFLGPDYPRITQDIADTDADIMLSSDIDDEKDMAYITNMVSGSVAGYKYFDIKQTGSIALWVRGYVDGEVTVWQASPDDRFDEKTGHIGHRVGSVHVGSENIWTRYEMKVDMSGGVSALYFEYIGSNALQFLKFELIRN